MKQKLHGKKSPYCFRKGNPVLKKYTRTKRPWLQKIWFCRLARSVFLNTSISFFLATKKRGWNVIRTELRRQ